MSYDGISRRGSIDYSHIEVNLPESYEVAKPHVHDAESTLKEISSDLIAKIDQKCSQLVKEIKNERNPHLKMVLSNKLENIKSKKKNINELKSELKNIGSLNKKISVISEKIKNTESRLLEEPIDLHNDSPFKKGKFNLLDEKELHHDLILDDTRTKGKDKTSSDDFYHKKLEPPKKAGPREEAKNKKLKEELKKLKSEKFEINKEIEKASGKISTLTGHVKIILKDQEFAQSKSLQRVNKEFELLEKALPTNAKGSVGKEMSKIKKSISQLRELATKGKDLSEKADLLHKKISETYKDAILVKPRFLSFNTTNKKEHLINVANTCVSQVVANKELINDAFRNAKAFISKGSDLSDENRLDLISNLAHITTVLEVAAKGLGEAVKHGDVSTAPQFKKDLESVNKMLAAARLISQTIEGHQTISKTSSSYQLLKSGIKEIEPFGLTKVEYQAFLQDVARKAESNLQDVARKAESKILSNQDLILSTLKDAQLLVREQSKSTGEEKYLNIKNAKISEMRQFSNEERLKIINNLSFITELLTKAKKDFDKAKGSHNSFEFPVRTQLNRINEMLVSVELLNDKIKNKETMTPLSRENTPLNTGIKAANDFKKILNPSTRVVREKRFIPDRAQLDKLTKTREASSPMPGLIPIDMPDLVPITDQDVDLTDEVKDFENQRDSTSSPTGSDTIPVTDDDSPI